MNNFLASHFNGWKKAKRFPKMPYACLVGQTGMADLSKKFSDFQCCFRKSSITDIPD